MVTLALLLRAVPEALLALAPSLLARGRGLSSPGRLPLLLWLLTQATGCVRITLNPNSKSQYLTSNPLELQTQRGCMPPAPSPIQSRVLYAHLHVCPGFEAHHSVPFSFPSCPKPCCLKLPCAVLGGGRQRAWPSGCGCCSRKCWA